MTNEEYIIMRTAGRHPSPEQSRVAQRARLREEERLMELTEEERESLRLLMSQRVDLDARPIANFEPPEERLTEGRVEALGGRPRRVTIQHEDPEARWNFAADPEYRYALTTDYHNGYLGTTRGETMATTTPVATETDEAVRSKVKKHLCTIITSAVKASGKTPKTIAIAARVKETDMSNFLGQNVMPSLTTVEKIVEACGMELHLVIAAPGSELVINPAKR